MRANNRPTERLALGVFAAALGTTLAAWAWLTVWSGMGYHADWWVLMLPASALAGAAFSLDASSTARFGRSLIMKCERAPLLRLVAGRYALRSCFFLQAVAEAGLIAAAPWLLPGLPAHHLLAGLLVFISMGHCYAWQHNNRFWAEETPR